MTGFTTRIATLALTGAAMLTSCAGCIGIDDTEEIVLPPIYGSDSEPPGEEEPGNQPPQARSLLERTVFLGGETVTLDGSASSDPEGDPITQEWGMTGKVSVYQRLIRE